MTSTILHGQTQGQTNTNESETFCLGKKRRKCMQILKVAATNTFITCFYNICGVLRQLIVENKSVLYLEVTTLL